tara:strand:- start:84 stop:704 length:621 start_codon:yes stop_codon:yes gene_type:complete
MGILRNFDLNRFAGIESFVETGTQDGVGLEYAHKNGGFLELHSIEINEGYFNSARAKFSHAKNISLWHGNSIDKMPLVLKSIENYSSCFYWLDAHIPEDTKKYPFFTEDEEVIFPLEKEFELIVKNRDITNDYFLIDDLRVYIEGPFQYPWDSHPDCDKLRQKYPNYFPHKNGVSFVEDLIGATHSIEPIWDHEGYLYVYPKDRRL